MPRNRNLRDRLKFAIDIVRGIAEPNINTKKSPYVTSFNYNQTPQRSLLDYQTFYTEGFEENPLIYSAVMVKAKGITQAKLTAYKYLDEKRKKYEEIPYTDNLPKLLKRPNYYQSNDEFFSLQDAFLNLTGNSFTYLERKTRNSEVIALWPLNPAAIYIIPDDKGEIKGYEYEPLWAAGEKFPIEVQNMAHVKLPNPNDPLNGLGFGLSPIMPMSMTGDVDNMITKFLNVFFKHGAMPPGILKFKDMALDENEMADYREKWKEIYGGYTNWSDIGILDAHGEYQRIGLTFEEMNFEKLDQRNETRILATLGVPIELLPNVSALTGSTYANKKEARTMFWEDTMMFELEMFEQEFNRVLFNQDLETDIFVKWDTSEVPALKREMATQVDSAVKLIEKGVPPQVAFNTVGLEIEDYEGIEKPFAQPAPSFQEVQDANKERFKEQNENSPFSKKPDENQDENTDDSEEKNNPFLA